MRVFVLCVAFIVCVVVLLFLATPRSAPDRFVQILHPGLRGAPHLRLLAQALSAAPRYTGTATWYCSTVATCTRIEAARAPWRDAIDADYV